MSRAEVNAKIAAITGCQYALITLRQASEAGLSEKAVRHRVSTGEWTVVRRGVYRVTAASRSWRQEMLAAVLAGGDGVVAGALSGMALWRVPGFPMDAIQLRTQYGKSRRPLQGGPAQSCLLLPHHCTVVDRIPVTTPTRTIFDALPLINALRAERALDNMLAMRLTSIDKLETLLDELGQRGRTGTALMRELMADRGVGYMATESELERMFDKFVLRYGLPRPRRQVSFIAGRVDFLFDPGGVIAELDGRRNHTALLDREADMERDARLAAMGLLVIRIGYRRLTRDPDGVYADLHGALRRAA
jgi:very-short-patch-repair endonuclease